MGVFFVGWELWQEMTFVLACCIVLVFGFGLVKLWWTNRSLRRLEVIDEEKRARVSTLSHCGLHLWRPPEIPFGVRAIQNGIEVEGIWISRPNTPDMSQVASSTAICNTTTLVEDQTELSKGKERLSDTVSTISPYSSSVFEGSRSRHPSTLASSQSVPTVSSLELPQYPDRETPALKGHWRPPQTYLHPNSYTERIRGFQRRNTTTTSSCSDDPFLAPCQTSNASWIRGGSKVSGGLSPQKPPTHATAKAVTGMDSTELSRSSAKITDGTTPVLRGQRQGQIITSAKSKVHQRNSSSVSQQKSSPVRLQKDSTPRKGGTVPESSSSGQI